MTARRRPAGLLALILAAILTLSGCGWRGLNSVPLPGTTGGGSGSFTISAELPDITNIGPNSRVRVGDVTVGNVTRIERQGWHALVTMRLSGGVQLPANATATVGQTSLLGSLHIELAAPTDQPPHGRLTDGGVLPLDRGGAYPTTEETLAVVAMLLNGGGIGKFQDVTEAFSTAFAGREDEFRSVIEQLDVFVGHLDAQRDDMLRATESLDRLTAQFAEQRPVLHRALDVIPDALAVLRDQRTNLTEAFDQFGKLSALAAEATNQTKEAFVAELKHLGPVLQTLADAGPAMTRSLSFLGTYPWPKETITNWVRGDYANLTAIIDLTLSRLDSSLFTGTRWEGNLTELEMQWGRTIGQLPSPYTSGNPLLVPYRLDQGP